MGSVFSPLAESAPKGADSKTPDLRKQVRGLISTLLYEQDCKAERRRQLRYAFPLPVYLTGVDTDGVTPVGESITAVGKDLSESGLGFYHVTPAPSRRMIVSLQMGDGRWMSFVIDVRRSRAIRQSWYESGGRFVEAVATPKEIIALGGNATP